MIIGDDQGELFSLSNMPAISVYYGDEIATNDIWGRSDKPDWMRQLAVGYAMDENNASLVTAEMQAKVDEAAAKIKSGELTVHDYMSDNTCPAATF